MKRLWQAMQERFLRWRYRNRNDVVIGGVAPGETIRKGQCLYWDAAGRLTGRK